jgi:hypothetical protein
MSISYFRRRAAQCYRDAWASLVPHRDYELLIRLGMMFKDRAAAARARLARRRETKLLRDKEARRKDLYSHSRE